MPAFTFTEEMERELARRTSETCDQIVSEIGAEVHDDLIQKLSVFRLYIDRIERAIQNPEEIEAVAIRMRSDFEQVIRTVRSISRRLLPVRTEGETLANAVSVLCQNMEVPGTGHIHLTITGTPRRFDPQREAHVLRIIQELIQNAFRHSSAWHVWVRLTWTSKSLNVEVEDDGSGFSRLEEFIERLGKKHNTLSMRANALHATLEYRRGERGLLAAVVLGYFDS